VVCFALGLSALFTGPTNPFEPLIQVAPPVIAVITGTMAVLVAIVVFGVVRSRRVGNATPVGATVSPGAVGEVRSPLSPLGSVLANGEEWSARTLSGQPLERGTPIRVVKVEGLTLTVEPDASSSKAT
jgi:membrane-bound serine protease (ClpP class)